MWSEYFLLSFEWDNCVIPFDKKQISIKHDITAVFTNYE